MSNWRPYHLGHTSTSSSHVFSKGRQFHWVGNKHRESWIQLQQRVFFNAFVARSSYLHKCRYNISPEDGKTSKTRLKIEAKMAHGYLTARHTSTYPICTNWTQNVLLQREREYELMACASKLPYLGNRIFYKGNVVNQLNRSSASCGCILKVARLLEERRVQKIHRASTAGNFREKIGCNWNFESSI